MELEFPVHHVIVVGFHHKKGCQVEFAYPSFPVDLEKTAWKHLPSLAMPDGAHNYATDTVYFHLPSLKDPRQTVFGVACYQQIDAEKVKNKGEDVTRSKVQKSICVISKYPLYGHIQVKMALITAAYFREGDFSQVSILEEAYHNLNASLEPALLSTPEAFVGLSPRDLIAGFKHQTITLLKLLLLEKRILFRGASVGPLCSALLTLVSLLPLTLEYGLDGSACVRMVNRSLSFQPDFEEEKMDPEKPSSGDSLIQGSVSDREHEHAEEDMTDEAIAKNEDLSPTGSKGSSSNGDAKEDKEAPDFLTAVQMTSEESGLPLRIFSNGYLCHPYLSLHYMDLLSDAGVRGYLVGATNILFKQKRTLFEAIVEMEDGSIDIPDPTLKRSVALTTEDLRFADNLVKTVLAPDVALSEDSFMAGVGWEGGDEWIRAQMKYYVVTLLRTSLAGQQAWDSFNACFVSEWRLTQSWSIWNEYVNSDERKTPGIYMLAPGHPSSGQVTVSDIKLRMTQSQGGKKIGEAVEKAGKALSQAKGAFSSWWTTVVTSQAAGVEIGEEKREEQKPNDKGGQAVWFA